LVTVTERELRSKADRAASEVLHHLLGEDRVISEAQAARELNLSNATLKTLRRNGLGPRYISLSEARVGYRLKDLRAWLDARARVKEADVDEQRQAAKTILSAVRRKRAADTQWMQTLRGTPIELATRLMEAVALLEYVASLSDRPDEFVNGLAQAALGGR
jgi:hypothetical protein